MIDSCSGGQKVFWETVRAVNGGDSRATAVALQKFLDTDGVECVTPKANADAAAKHFTKVYNTWTLPSPCRRSRRCFGS